jgi:hypothetical protein
MTISSSNISANSKRAFYCGSGVKEKFNKKKPEVENLVAESL